MIDLFSPFTLNLNDLRKDMHLPEEMRKICEAHAPLLKTSVDPIKLLKTIATLESSFGQDCSMRFEANYFPGGIYFQKSSLLRNAFDEWKVLVSCSYGPFQILYCKALELGFPIMKDPLFLWHGDHSVPYVCEIINDFSSRGIKELEDILGAYNGGVGVLKMKPKLPPGIIKYIQDGIKIFNSFK